MRIYFEARPTPSRLAVWLTPIIATVATIVVGFVVFGALGKDPFAALRAFFIAPIATRYGVAELLLKATPLMLIATGLAIGYRANVWNIGAEGQLTLGAIAGGGIALAVGDAPWPSFVLLPAMFIAGAAAGMAWAAIPAWLRTRFNAN
jgi:simple sugar transport system permease protein